MEKLSRNAQFCLMHIIDDLIIDNDKATNDDLARLGESLSKTQEQTRNAKTSEELDSIIFEHLNKAVDLYREIKGR